MKSLVIVMMLLFTLVSAGLSQNQGEWLKVESFSGSSNTTTDDFEITGKKWRVRWTAENQNAELGVHFGLAIYNGEEIVDLAANVMQATSGESVYRTKGTHHLQITCLFANWKVEVEEFVQKKRRSR